MNTVNKPISWKEFLSTLSEDDLVQIIRDYELFCDQGTIGDCLLRTKANEWEANVDFWTNVVLIMRDLAFHAYQHFAHLYMAEHIS